ncbi:MAG: hypothetical protein IJ134_00045 [Bacilli bacterium]|nr:hypothetical protein [Bacilli bacterium]
MKAKIKQFKEIWNNKIYHSIIILGFYAIFFLFIFLFLSFNKTQPKVYEKNIDSLSLYENMKSYDYKLSYTKDINKTVTGTYCNNNYYFVIDSDIYKYSNNMLYKNNTTINRNDLFLDILRFNNTDIYNLIKKSILNETITYSNYKKQIYTITSNEYYNWYNNTTSNLENILITLTIEKNYITKIELEKTNDFKLEIVYENINQVKKVDE